MPNLRDIQRRINSVKSTRQITKAMKMVAAAKLRRAQEKVIAARPYAGKMTELLGRLAQGMGSEDHPLFDVRPDQNVGILVLSSDRGLCGAYNTNVFKHVEQRIAELEGDGRTLFFWTVGKKALSYFKRRGVDIRNSWLGLSGGKVDYSSAAVIGKELVDQFNAEEIDKVLIIGNTFRSVLVQTVEETTLLPIEPPGAEGEDTEVGGDMIFEPSEKEILGDLLPRYVETLIFKALLENQAAEEAARMAAMENATKSASEMIESLTLQFNKARQASITAELMDIIRGAEAVK